MGLYILRDSNRGCLWAWLGCIQGVGDRLTVDSKQLEHLCRMICASVPSFFGLGLEDSHVETCWLSREVLPGPANVLLLCSVFLVVLCV